MILPMLIDVVVVGLLAVTIYYCFRVDTRLRALRSGKDELKQVIGALNDCTLRAQQSIEQLRAAGAETSEQLEARVRHGRELADELDLMMQAGNNLADRLEASRPGASQPVKESNPLELAVSNEGKTAEAPGFEGAEGKAESISEGLENELLKALRQAR